MTHLVKVEKRKRRWVRADTGAPLTCEELHRAYYLEALNRHVAADTEEMACFATWALSITPEEMGLFIEFLADEEGYKQEIIDRFKKWRAIRSSEKAGSPARSRLH